MIGSGIKKAGRDDCREPATPKNIKFKNQIKKITLFQHLNFLLLYL